VLSNSSGTATVVPLATRVEYHITVLCGEPNSECPCAGKTALKTMVWLKFTEGAEVLKVHNGSKLCVVVLVVRQSSFDVTASKTRALRK
jgi:hypothetical protein